MSRPIKFRAWDGEDMSFAMNIGDLIASHMDYEEGETIVMQFTGLLDKNGKEIYEGDVVRGRDCSGGENTQVVEYEDCAFRPLGIDNGCGDQEMTGPEVIGNIYENPELLNAKEV